MTAMLLCLDREQRFVYILGIIFQVTDKVAADILDITPANYRQKLSRARKQIFSFMHDKCGLMDKKNPCRCEKKTKALLDCGYVNPDNLLFNINYVHSVEGTAELKIRQLDDLFDEQCVQLFREHPFQEPPDFVAALRKILEQDEFREIFNFTN
jgi:hypothetical protein